MSIPADVDARPRYRRVTRTVDATLVREAFAAIFVVLGLVGLGVSAYVTDVWLGVAFTSAVFTAAGVLLGLDR